MEKFSALPRSFYDRSSTEVAKALLGKLLVRKIMGEVLVGMIVETEAYLSTGDEAAHGFKGKTKRNSSLYKEGGHAYVHGMRQYHLLDIVVEGVDVPASVLIRALEPVQGIEEMRKRRGENKINKLTSGPGKLCIALGIAGELDGTDVTDSKNVLFVADNHAYISPEQILTSTRIGITKSADAPLRFHLIDNIHVSKRKG